MRNILLILFLFFACKKEEMREEIAIKYEWNGKSNSGQASTTGLEVTYTYSNEYTPQRVVTDNNRLNSFWPIPVEKGFV